ncbi:hypothetical protein BJF85_11855 [Saccharomonospora sp. CUA-673]|uniref:DUF2505 domain-containing protein n=1 Tax=Saccharomonospora sp. CUA-673 TaxID=1904969 RepID=UPI00095FF200|nr:DUF2505 domain-containing protein [Saccharomonospora sp. CUA-673]OLT48796.1 hypothetical protein BJF85_11855 [Saccharomonospora sp. CUA-673]
MASRIEHRATFPASVADVVAAQSDEAALRARLAEIGGPDAALESHEVTGDGVRYTLRQAVPVDKLPSVAQKFVSGDLVVRREHTVSGTSGDIRAEVQGVPAEITATVSFTENPGDPAAAVQVTRGEVTVRIPLVGGKLEGVIAEQVTTLLEREAEFTTSWLTRS